MAVRGAHPAPHLLGEQGHVSEHVCLFEPPILAYQFSRGWEPGPAEGRTRGARQRDVGEAEGKGEGEGMVSVSIKLYYPCNIDLVNCVYNYVLIM